jgi:hypothetical protein
MTTMPTDQEDYIGYNRALARSIRDRIQDQKLTKKPARTSKLDTGTANAKDTA